LTRTYWHLQHCTSLKLLRRAFGIVLVLLLRQLTRTRVEADSKDQSAALKRLEPPATRMSALQMMFLSLNTVVTAVTKIFRIVAVMANVKASAVYLLSRERTREVTASWSRTRLLCWKHYATA
jgi:hypothetical protein